MVHLCVHYFLWENKKSLRVWLCVLCVGGEMNWIPQHMNNWNNNNEKNKKSCGKKINQQHSLLKVTYEINTLKVLCILFNADRTAYFCVMVYFKLKWLIFPFFLMCVLCYQSITMWTFHKSVVIDLCSLCAAMVTSDFIFRVQYLSYFAAHLFKNIDIYTNFNVDLIQKSI